MVWHCPTLVTPDWDPDGIGNSHLDWDSDGIGNSQQQRPPLALPSTSGGGAGSGSRDELENYYSNPNSNAGKKRLRDWRNKKYSASVPRVFAVACEFVTCSALRLCEVYCHPIQTQPFAESLTA
ncbi:Hypothetical predicted protein [Olea europaea subsp. europaea]|uniref:Uncharacterized protein n=1 Tax=Olea europaea subsp. europaea TaxID=158383 RepID=A0A8S0QSM3_OLEEU|nr:Hypothetical predicted protein [Olea europaea subsp. europaea]